MKNELEFAVSTPIPAGWSVKKVGQLADLTAGGTPSTGVPDYWGGDIPWMSSGEVNLGKITSVEGRITELGFQNSSAKIIPVHSVLMALAGQGKTRGKVAFNEIELCTNQSLAAIMPRKGLDYKFLFYNLESRYDEIRAMSSGDGGRGGLNLTIIKSIQLPFPPLPEQRKIAEILSTLDEKMAVIDEQLAQTQELKKGLMQRLLTRGIGHTQFKDSPLGEIPASWEVARFEECLGDKNPLSYGILQPGEGVDDGIPMLRTVDLAQNGLADTKILKVPKAISAQYEKTVLRGGEILFSVMGTLGRTAVVEDSWVGWNVNRALAVIRLNSKVDRFFFSHILKSPIFQTHIIKQSIGSAQMRINLGDLRTYWIQIPPLPEQRQIAEILTTIDDKIGVLQDKKAQYHTLKKGLMQQLLTGQRRVRVGAPAETAALV